jgi:RHS repeat-associated protein
MTRIRVSVLASVVLGLAAGASGQDHPNLQRGFFADQTYQLSNIDSVNLYNGNLTLAIPIGQTYHVGGNLSYGFTLYYNSNVWDFEERQFYPPNPDGGCALPPESDPEWLTVALPVKGVNAGLGWTLSLGALDGPYGQSDSPSWVYTSPDGSKHAFFSTLHDDETTQMRTTSPCSPSAPCNVYYTRDNTYLRLIAIVDSCGKVLGGDVEFPDGTVHHFDTGNPACCSSGCSTTARLTQIRDPFGNTLTISYPTNAWQLSDGFRTTTVYFTSGLLGQQVDRVEAAAFNGTTATYQFHYTTVTICRSCKQSDMTGYCRPMSTTVNVPLLLGVSLPDGSSYCMTSDCTNFAGTPSYNIPATGCSSGSCTISPKDLPGTLQQVQLPTGGTTAWTYSAWAHDPAGGICSCTPISTCAPTGWPLDAQESAGVYQRTLCDPISTPGQNLCGTWTYAHESPYTRNLAGAPNEARTTVTSPAHDGASDDTVYYFRAQACYGFDGYNPYGWDYSLPYTKNQDDGEPSPNTKSLSTQFFRGTGGTRTLRRSVYVTYANDIVGTTPPSTPEYWYYTNRRLSSQRTVYNDDSGAYANIALTQFDGLGHYRSASTDGTFGSGNVRTTLVHYNPDMTPGTMWYVNSPWVINTFDSQTQTEGGVTAKQEYCFDSATGAVLRSRVLTSGTSESASDLVGVFSYTSGNLTREQYYGGDAQAVNTGTLCSLGLPSSNQVRIDHTWQYGSLRTSRYVDGSGANLSFLNLDRDVDSNTGFPSRSRDSAGLATDFTYDSMGRLTWEKPQAPPVNGGAWVNYAYTAASGTNPARANVYAYPNGTTSGALAQEEYRYDGLGRLFKQRQLRASGAWNQKLYGYNGLGWMVSESEVQADGTSGSAVRNTVLSGFDAFGRPGTVTPPDGSAHVITLTYAGARQVSRTVKVATSTSAETNAVTTEIYDRQGRLYQVTEQSGTGDANVTTSYGYDVGNRLKQTGTTSGSTTQNRYFTYDNRGFLTSEQLPEKGASGNGLVNYYTYDARGHVGRIADGPNDLTFSYDRAERLAQVRETGGSQRTLKSFTFATANGANDWANGKLRQATANNWYDISVPTSNFLSQETYTYGGVGGRVSQRDTLAGIVGGNQGTFTATFTWSDLGVPATVTYPQKAGVGPARTVTFDYTNGWLTRVHEGTTNYASSISYHANGMVNQVARPNSTTDTYAKDSNDIARPASVRVQGLLGLTLWYTGTYTYDGSGNVWKMTNGGNIDTFVYDKVSRLREGKIISVAKKQCQSYDAFGNIKGQATVASSQTCTPSSWSVDSATNRMGSPVTYDAAGEQLSWNSGAYVYWWYPTGQVRQFDSSGRVTIHGYSADGERVVTYDSSLAGITYTLRGLDAKVLRVYREASGVWTWLQDYVYRDGAHLATVDSTGTRHFHLDHLGSIRLITNSSGSQVALHTYYPFGQEATSTGQDNERMKFTGHERDLRDTSVTTDDLDYMHARYYNPNLGRFLSTDLLRGDPHQPQSFHLFAYVQNNPITYVDPFGLARDDGVQDKVEVKEKDPCPWAPQGWSCRDWSFFTGYASFLWWADYYHRLGGIPAGLRLSGSPQHGTHVGQPCTLQVPSGVYQVDPSAALPVVASFQPPMTDALSSAFRDLNSQGIVPMITSGFRTAADQMWLRKGGSGPNPAAALSWHQVGSAVDLNTQTSSFSAIRAAMIAQGLTWGGTFRRREPWHFQLAPAGTTPSLATITACGGD